MLFQFKLHGDIKDGNGFDIIFLGLMFYTIKTYNFFQSCKDSLYAPFLACSVTAVLLMKQNFRNTEPVFVWFFLNKVYEHKSVIPTFDVIFCFS